MTIDIVNYSKIRPQIRNFSKDRYVETSYMEKEWLEIWKTSWLLAGLESDLKKPGDYFVFDMGREQILVTKKITYKFKAFSTFASTGVTD